MIRPKSNKGEVSPFPLLSTDDFLALGLDAVVYTRPVQFDGIKLYAVHAADGTELLMAGSPAEARAEAMRHHLRLVTLH